MLKVKVIKNVNLKRGPIIPEGEECTVRILPTAPFQFNPPYQIIDGPYSGHILSRDCCIELSNEKTFTGEEVIKIEKIYQDIIEKELKEKEKAVELAANASKQLVEKDKEIEKLTFYLKASGLALEAVIESLQRVKELEEKQNG